MDSKIVVVGSLNMDLVAFAERIPVAGETLTGRSFHTLPGGKGANQAYAAARLGARVAMLGRVGDDDFGRALTENLRAAGCDVGGVLRTEATSTGIALIVVSDAAQNSIVIVAGANGMLAAGDVAGAGAFREAGCVLLQLESPMETVIAAAREARRAGARVILDPAPAPASALPAELLANVDILTPNETEAAILAGLPPRRISAGEAFEIAGRLRAGGPATVIVKLGEQGVALSTAEMREVLAAPRVNAVDTTAAGDVFNGALAVALSEGRDLKAACAFANRAAAISVTRKGAQASAPTRAEVEGFRG